MGAHRIKHTLELCTVVILKLILKYREDLSVGHSYEGYWDIGNLESTFE